MIKHYFFFIQSENDTSASKLTHDIPLRMRSSVFSSRRVHFTSFISKRRFCFPSPTSLSSKPTYKLGFTITFHSLRTLKSSEQLEIIWIFKPSQEHQEHALVRFSSQLKVWSSHSNQKQLQCCFWFISYYIL